MWVACHESRFLKFLVPLSNAFSLYTKDFFVLLFLISCLSHRAFCVVGQQQVLLRISTHEIGSVIHHVDDGKHHLLVIERSVKDSPESSYYLYECQSEVRRENLFKDFCSFCLLGWNPDHGLDRSHVLFMSRSSCKNAFFCSSVSFNVAFVFCSSLLLRLFWRFFPK